MPSVIKFDLTHQIFGRLTVIERVANNRFNEPMWKCRCECGNLTTTSTKVLRAGESTSCGCYARERVSQTHTTHGLSSHRLYRIWTNMKERCYNPNDIGFDNYGGRGIRICEVWLSDVIAFYDWAMYNGYQDNLTIDRYPDIHGDYEPNNCRWVTMSEQNQNQSTTKITPEQVEMIRADSRPQSVIACEYNVDQSTISRIKRQVTWSNI